jgi:cold shock CspA family protein
MEQLTQTQERIYGRVRKWVTSRGFGFVAAEFDEREFFLHVRSVVSPADTVALVEGQLLEFTPQTTDRGLSAVDAVVVE